MSKMLIETQWNVWKWRDKLLLFTGARRNEITHAKGEYTNWDRGTLLVPRSKSVQVTPAAARDVKARLRDRNALDPVDWIDFWIARIAVLRDPIPGPAAVRRRKTAYGLMPSSARPSWATTSTIALL
jgi:integrase